MSPIARILPRLWALVPVCACAYVVWADQGRAARVGYVCGLEGRARSADVLSAASPTGYADGQRELIVPEGNEDSFAWIAQTQQMFALGQARVRHVDYENAPAGHEVAAASPYRWWLGLVAWLDREATGRPAGFCVERAALCADPLLHLALVAGGAAFVAWRFGGFAAALLSVGLVGFFPFASRFLPGMPDQRGLAEILAFSSVLLLLPGLEGRLGGSPSARGARAWFALAGAVGALGMWVSVPTQAPVTAGIVLGGLLEALVRRRAPGGDAAGGRAAPPWRTWSLCGGAAVLAAYLAEYFPGDMGPFRMESVHPLYGLAWMGAGELLARASAWIAGGGPGRSARDLAAIALSAAAVAGLPAAHWATGGPTFLAKDSLWARLGGLPNSPVAASSRAWLAHGWASPAAAATLLPLAAAALAAWLVLRPEGGSRARPLLAVALGPAAVAAAFASERLGWWGIVDATLLPLVVAGAAGGAPAAGRPRGRWLWAAVVLASAAPGVALLSPQGPVGQATVLSPSESEQLTERHLAHWLARRSGAQGAVVFAPPRETAALAYFGGLRGIGTFAADNAAGFGATLSIAAAPTMEEAESGLRSRDVRFVVIPSWDPFFEDFARLYLVKKYADRSSLLVRALRTWNLPPWLRPVPYQLPVGGGSVLVFEVVDEQSPAAAASRLAEYFVETGDLDRAAAAAEALRRFPGDLGALAAREQVQSARGDAAAAARTLESLLARLSNGGDRYLAWDRRVSVATVLAREGRIELARGQTRRCVADLNEARLRSLSTGSLYDLLVIARAFGIEIEDPGLRDLAISLLPENLRGRI